MGKQILIEKLKELNLTPSSRILKKLVPFHGRFLYIRREDLHLVATAEHMTQGYKPVIDLGPDGLVSDLGMDLVCKIKGC